jgi:hypothetical protein
MRNNNTPPIEYAVVSIKNAPRLSVEMLIWENDITVPIMVAMAIRGSANQIDAARKIANRTNTNMLSLQSFARGNKADGTIWPELRERLTAEDVRWEDSLSDGRSVFSPANKPKE